MRSLIISKYWFIYYSYSLVHLFIYSAIYFLSLLKFTFALYSSIFISKPNPCLLFLIKSCMYVNTYINDCFAFLQSLFIFPIDSYLNAISFCRQNFSYLSNNCEFLPIYYIFCTKFYSILSFLHSSYNIKSYSALIFLLLKFYSALLKTFYRSVYFE